MDFNFAHFEIEESFRLIWVKLPNDRLYLQISILGYLKVAHFTFELYFCSFCV